MYENNAGMNAVSVTKKQYRETIKDAINLVNDSSASLDELAGMRPATPSINTKKDSSCKLDEMEDDLNRLINGLRDLNDRLHYLIGLF